jgi:hypothetical protein
VRVIAGVAFEYAGAASARNFSHENWAPFGLPTSKSVQFTRAATVNLTDVLITDQLQLRNSRAPNLTSENDALHRLALHVTKPGDELLDELLTAALRICDAGTAGVSAFDAADPRIVRWIAIVGRLAQLTGGSAPLDSSPCGVTIAAEEPQLFSRPGEHFAPQAPISQPVYEALVVPILTPTEIYGAIWIVSHSEKHGFDMEDVRVMTSLAAFAALACRTLGIPSRVRRTRAGTSDSPMRKSSELSRDRNG